VVVKECGRYSVLYFCCKNSLGSELQKELDVNLHTGFDDRGERYLSTRLARRQTVLTVTPSHYC
jgi:hypothetical protein